MVINDDFNKKELEAIKQAIVFMDVYIIYSSWAIFVIATPDVRSIIEPL